MKKKLVIHDGELHLGITLALTYFVDSTEKIELRRICYIPKSDYFGYNYNIPKTYLKLFKGKVLTKDLEKLLEIHNIEKFEVVISKIYEYNELKSKRFLK